MLNISKETNGTSLVVTLEGRLDTTTAPELEGVLRDSLEGKTELTLDIEKLEYLSSAGLRVLLSFRKKMDGQGTMVIRNATDAVKEIFEVTGFSVILNIE